MEIFWGALGVIAWVGWSFTRDKKWQKPIFYWFVMVQICLVSAFLMVKSLQASQQPSAFLDDMLKKTIESYSLPYLNKTGPLPWEFGFA